MTSNWNPPKDYETRPVAILGSGVLGRRIACCWTAAGYNVNIRDPSEKQRNDALDYIRENVVDYAKATNRTPGTANAYVDLASAVKDAWIVFEAVPEDLQMKIDTFAELEALASGDCILTSNSSSYKSSEMLEKVSNETKARILNVHYLMPPQIRVVEFMTDGCTHPEIFDFLVERHREAALHPYVALKESTGFIYNRLWAAVKRETLSILSEGVTTAPQLDEIFRKVVGAPYGPCLMMDHVGLDTVAAIEKHYVAERGLPDEHTVKYLEENFLKHGKLGFKCDKGGFYPPMKKPEQQPAKPEEPKVLVLDVGLSQPLANRGVEDIINSGKLLEISDGGKSVRTLAEKIGMPDGIDVCDDRLYWTDMGVPSQNNGRVLCCKTDGSDMQVIVARGKIHTPKQLTIDQGSKKIYISDREGLRVFRCDLDGSNLEVIVQTGDWQNKNDKNDMTNWCVGIAISPKLDKIFWTQKGPSKAGKGRIFSANINVPANQTAENRKDIHCLLDNLPEPIDLELDEENNILYWTDRGEVPFGNTLNKIQLDDCGNPILGHGLIKHGIIAQNFNEAIGLKLDARNQVVYVSDMGGAVWRCGLDGERKARIYEDQNAAFTGLALLKA